MALCANPFVVEVAKGAAHTPPPPCGASNGERVVAADGEAAGVDGTSLGRAVKLELAVGNDRTSAAVLVVEDAVLERARKGAISSLDVRQ